MPDGRDTRSSRFFSSAVSWLLRNSHLAVVLTAAFWAFHLQSDVLSGTQNRAGDNTAHLLAQHWIDHAVEVDDNPFGPLGIDFGTPLLQFYQPLHGLLSVTVSRVTSLELSTVHSHIVAILFSLSPFSLCFLFRRIGLSKWASATAAVVSLTSVSSFSSSFEAYYSVGLATQALAFFLFPLFIGSLVGVLRRESGIASAALLLGFSLLAHSMMAVYIFLCVILLVVTMPASWKKNWKRAAVVGILGVVIASFWLVPFIHNTSQFRQVSTDHDNSTGPAWWFNGVTKTELFELATTGRLWDGPRSVERQRPQLDDLSDRNDLFRSKRVRPPVLTLMVLAGVVASLLRLKRASRRFVLGGFVLSLGLYVGPDDFPLLRLVPFIEQIQVFRTIYLLEIFSFGLVAVAVHEILVFVSCLVRRIGGPVVVSASVAAVVVCAPAIIWSFLETEQIAAATIDERQFPARNETRPVLVSRRTYPFRIQASYPGGARRTGTGFEETFFQDHCTHWAGVGPKSNLDLCAALRVKETTSDLYRYAAIRFFSGPRMTTRRGPDKNVELLESLFSDSGISPKTEMMKNDYFIDTRHEEFGTFFQGPVVSVRADSAQWNTLVQMWLNVASKSSELDNTALPVHQFNDRESDIPGAVELDLTDLSSNASDLSVLIDQRWRNATHHPKGKAGSCQVSLANEPDYLGYQHFALNTSCERATLVVIPILAARGWTAEIDESFAPLHSGASNFLAVLVPEGSHSLALLWQWGALELFAAGAALLVTMLLLLSIVLKFFLIH